MSEAGGEYIAMFVELYLLSWYTCIRKDSMGSLLEKSCLVIKIEILALLHDMWSESVKDLAKTQWYKPE